MLERNSGLRKVFERNGKLHLFGEKERLFFSQAVLDFTGQELPITYDIKPDGNSTVRRIPHKDISVEFMDYNSGINWNDPFFDYLVGQLPIKDQIYFNQYVQTPGAGRMIMIRRTSPTEEFKNAVNNHAKIYHHGALSFTELRLEQVNDSLQNGHANQSPVEPEDSTLETILKSAKNSIKFYALTTDKRINRIINVINEKSDPYELDYNKALTIQYLARKKSGKSGYAIALGIALGFALDPLIKNSGEETAQIGSQVFGEIVAMLIASGDRIPSSESKLPLFSGITHYLGISAQAMKHLPDHMKAMIFSKAEIYHKLRHYLVQRTAVIGATLATTVALSELSQQQETLGWYAIIPALNTTLITAYEMYERTHAYKNIHISDVQFEELLKDIPKPLRAVYRHLPRSSALAYNDFAKNKYAVGSLAGSFLASALVMPLDSMNVPREWIYAIAGLIAEHTTALSFGRITSKIDPYYKFLKDNFF